MYNIKEVKELLKTEFIGLDEVIDKVVDYLDTYIKIKDTLVKPFVVNLWGMTGYGKTSLISRTVELMKLQSLMFNTSSCPTKEGSYFSFDDMIEFSNNDEKIFIFDEFHHMRSKDNMGGDEPISETSKIIWGILDNGIIGTDESTSSSIHKFKLFLKMLVFLKEEYGHLEYEVLSYRKVRYFGKSEEIKSIESYLNSFIYCYHGVYTNINEEVNNYESSLDISLNSDVLYPVMVNLSKDSNLLKNTLTIKDKCQTMDDIINFCKEVIDKGEKLFRVDVSKSIIFNLGNLDEIYGITDNHYTDLSSDECSDISKDITITDVNIALSHLFRPEHISRLGTNHIIYPVYNEKIFKKIIDKYIHSRVENTKTLGLNIVVDETLFLFIFKNYTYITLGVRNVISSVEDIMLKVISFCHNKGISGDVVVKYFEETEQITINDENTLILPKKKKPTSNEKALTAVHETGHMLIYFLLTGKKPAMVSCVTDMEGANGFMLRRHKDEVRYSNWNSLYQDVALCLGGLCAERVVFGESNMSMGGSSDIERATKLISYAVRDCGYILNDKGDFHVIGIAPLNSNVHTLREDGKYGVEEEEGLNKKIRKYLDRVYSDIIDIFSDKDVYPLLKDMSKKLYKVERFSKKELDIMLSAINEHITKRYRIEEDDYFEKLFG